jgi:hypothetical protein
MRRALERGNLLIAETSARECGRLTLQERLELTALISQKQPERGRRVAAVWLRRWIEEMPGVTIDDAALVASLLTALGGPRHPAALGALLEILESGERAAARPSTTKRLRTGA